MLKLSVNEYLKVLSNLEEKQEIHNFKNPNCTRCYECCGIAAPISEEEYKRLKKFLKTSEGQEIYKKSLKIKKQKESDGSIFMYCPFINFTNGRCRIYQHRPQVCKDFHCSPELRKKGYDKSAYREGYTIGSLFGLGNKK